MAQSGTRESERLPHACLISAPTREAALADARRLAAAAVCSGEGERPCGRCRDCRKVGAGVHPDVITVSRLTDDKGKQKQAITVDQIRALSADAIVLPNEAARKVYILDEAETMNPAAQNAALKLLEEPPAGAVFLLCTVNPLLLLPTVRSRCARYGVGGEEQTGADEAVQALAAGYLKAVAAGDEAQLLRWCMLNENVDARTLLAFTQEVRRLLTDTLCFRRKAKKLTRADMLRLCALMDKLAQYLKVNTGVRQLFGLLAAESLGGSGNRG
ncbi:MAG: DNA polymerase III subunit [Oscillospiraceae bacterium]|nr:DNA polymerase III subunit [Oscillospiraceae bacterium]